MNTHFLLLLIASSLLVACSSSNQQKIGNNFYPSKNKILYLSHQSSFQKDLNDLAIQPAGLVINTSLSLKLSHEIVKGYELNSVTPLFQQYPNLLPVFLFSIDRTQLQGLCEGEYEDRLQQLATFFESLQRPIYMTIGVDVTNPLYRIESEKYTAAYRCLVDRLEAMEVKNVAYVWYINSMLPAYENKDIEEWYPGDDYVNWIGTSLYKWQADHYVETTLFTAPNYERIFEFAAAKALPVMIVESSATSLKSNFSDNIEMQTAKDSTFVAPDLNVWESYYAAVLEFLEKNSSIRAFTPVYQEWSDDELTKQWHDALENSNFLFGTDQLHKKLGYKK